MESCLECGSTQIGFLIPLKCCSLGFMLELCHNTLFYDTANLIWQLTATRKNNLPSSLPFLPVLDICVCLLPCPGSSTLPTPLRDGSGERTDRKIFLSFFLASCLAPRLALRRAGWAPVSPGPGRRAKQRTPGAARGQQHTPGFLFCTTSCQEAVEHISSASTDPL